MCKDIPGVVFPSTTAAASASGHGSLAEMGVVEDAEWSDGFVVELCSWLPEGTR